jgi:hypothetical protein
MSLEDGEYYCDSSDYGHRAFLVGSNAIFLLNTIYCIILTVKYSLEWYSLIIETSIPLITGTLSAIYHLCDAGPGCSRICVTDWNTLYRLDFIFSYQIIHVVFTFSTDNKITYFKFLYHLAALLANIIFVNTYKELGFENYFYVIILCAGFLITIGRFIYLFNNHEFCHKFKYHFNFIAVSLALVCSLIGFFFKFYTSDEFTYYWWGHSLWHIFIGLGIFFAMNIYDLQALFCINRNIECPVCLANT